MIESATLAWIITFVILAVISINRYLGRNDDYWQKRGIPYMARIGYIRAIFKLVVKDLSELLKEMVDSPFGRVFGVFEGSQPAIVIAEPSLVRDILVKDFHIFPYRRLVETGDPIADNMVTLMTGEDWKRVRTIITPSFTSKRMRQMSSIINECSKSVVEVCEENCDKGKPVEFRSTFGAFSMDVIAKSAFGTQINSHKDPQNEFVKKVRENFLTFSIPRIILSILIPSRLLKYLPSSINPARFDKDNFFRDNMMKIIKKRRETGVRFNDFLQLLLDAAETETIEDEKDQFGSITNDNSLSTNFKIRSLSEDELLAQCILFFVVGYETTATVLTFLAYCLAVNPEWQEKLIKEVDESFQVHKEMSYDAVRDMKILDAVISETLRMHPPAVLTGRTCLEDYHLANTKIKIEKDMHVSISIYGMHYNPDFFQEPNTFNPERFMDSYEKKHPQYAYLPFGAGPRNCLGMRFALLEIKVCIANLLRCFRLKPHSTTKIPLKYKKEAVLLSVAELPLSLERRADVK